MLKSRGVNVDVLQEPQCMMRMMEFIRTEPELWSEDIGQEGPRLRAMLQSSFTVR